MATDKHTDDDNNNATAVLGLIDESLNNFQSSAAGLLLLLLRIDYCTTCRRLADMQSPSGADVSWPQPLPFPLTD